MNEAQNKTILAFDTSMAGVSVGVMASNGHIVSRQLQTARGQASMLMPMIQEVLDEAQIGFKDIDLLASTVGPGSFTGLRIGLTTAKTLSLSLDIPLIGLNTLEVMAHHYDTQNPLLVVLETKRQDFYAQYFNPTSDTIRTYLTDPFSGDVDVVLSRAPDTVFDIGGDCLSRFQQETSETLNLLDEWVQPDAILMAQMALRKFEHYDANEVIAPIYLRDADISMSKKPQRSLAQMDRN